MVNPCFLLATVLPARTAGSVPIGTIEVVSWWCVIASGIGVSAKSVDEVKFIFCATTIIQQYVAASSKQVRKVCN
jgi:hypothetical protein